MTGPGFHHELDDIETPGPSWADGYDATGPVRPPAYSPTHLLVDVLRLLADVGVPVPPIGPRAHEATEAARALLEILGVGAPLPDDPARGSGTRGTPTHATGAAAQTAIPPDAPPAVPPGGPAAAPVAPLWDAS